MTLRIRPLLLLIPLLLTASMALAAPPTSEAPPVPTAAAVAQSLGTVPAAAPVCQGTAPLLFAPDPQTAATELCGGCSDAACVGKAPHAVCGSGLRCISGGPSCTAAELHCRCLII